MCFGEDCLTYLCLCSPIFEMHIARVVYSASFLQGSREGDGTGLFNYILKAFMLKKEQRKQSGKKLLSIPVNEAEGEILQHNFHIPSGPSDVCITSAHSNKIIGLHEQQTFHYSSTWKQ